LIQLKIGGMAVSKDQDTQKLLELYALQAKLLGADTTKFNNLKTMTIHLHGVMFRLGWYFSSVTTSRLYIHTTQEYHEEIFEVFLYEVNKKRPLS